MVDQVLLYFFTGTGNSYRAASWMAESAQAQGQAARVIPLDGAQPAAEITEGSLVGVLTPTHGFTAPWAVIRFALRLPPGRGVQAFTVLCRAGFKIGRWVLPGLEGCGAYLLALVLWLKGYRVRGATGLDMPGAWTAVAPGQSPQAVEYINTRAHHTVLAFFDRILCGETAFRGLVPLILGLALLPISLVYLLMGRFFLAKLFYASPACRGCGVCARSCPVQAIKLKRRSLFRPGGARPYWTMTCESCTRCMNYCPNQAVEASYPFAALLIWLAGFPLFAQLFDWLTKVLPAAAFWKGTLLETAISYPYKLLVIVVAYFAFFWLLALPGVNGLLTLLTPTHYYRRYHEPATRLTDIRARKSPGA